MSAGELERTREARDRALDHALSFAKRLEEMEDERERARSLACTLLARLDWQTPSFLRSPEDAQAAIELRGIAVYDPSPLRDHPQLF